MVDWQDVSSVGHVEPVVGRSRDRLEEVVSVSKAVGEVEPVDPGRGGMKEEVDCPDGGFGGV